MLSEKVQEIGGELYTIELVKRQKNGEAMAALFNGLSGGDKLEDQLAELIEVINLLKEKEASSE